MQLTDEPDKRCYPLDECLLCHGCHVARLGLMTDSSGRSFAPSPVVANHYSLQSTSVNHFNTHPQLPPYPNSDTYSNSGSSSNGYHQGTPTPPPSSLGYSSGGSSYTPSVPYMKTGPPHNPAKYQITDL